MYHESRITALRERENAEPVPMFVRRESGNTYALLHAESGEAVTRLDASVYPAGSALSARYEHPNGIRLTRADCLKLGFRFGHPNRSKTYTYSAFTTQQDGVTFTHRGALSSAIRKARAYAIDAFPASPAPTIVVRDAAGVDVHRERL